MTDDLGRILALPVRQPLGEDLAPSMSEALRLHADAPNLTRDQAEALYWALALPPPYCPVLHLAVGGGKTLLALLLFRVLGAKRPLLLVPAGLEASAREQYEFWRAHYPVVLPTIMTYHQLSAKDGEARFAQVDPDVIVQDEAHNLSSLDSARTRRWWRTISQNPRIRVVSMSGTLVGRQVGRYAHLFEVSMGEHSPAPMDTELTQSLSVVMSEKGEPGYLEEQRAARIQAWAGVPDTYQAWGARLRATPGVVISTGTSCDASLHLVLHHKEPPAAVAEALVRLDQTWELPNGEPVMDAARHARHAQSLSLGFYYHWREQPPDDWLDARREWSRELRNICLYRDRPGFDTPALVRAALERGGWEREANHSAWLALQAWQAVEHYPEPQTEAVWLDGGAWLAALVETLLAAQRGGGGTGPLLWYRSDAVAARLRGMGLDVRGQGDAAPKGEAAACAIGVFGTGHRMHMYQRAGILESVLEPRAWQQLLGRLHRQGQEADQVVFDVLQVGAQPAMLARATRAAEADHSVSGDPQRLVFATRQHENHR